MENKRVKSQPKKNLWKPEEDMILRNYVETHGEGNWATVSQQSGYNLCQKTLCLLIFSFSVLSLGLCFVREASSHYFSLSLFLFVCVFAGDRFDEGWEKL